MTMTRLLLNESLKPTIAASTWSQMQPKDLRLRARHPAPHAISIGTGR